MKPLGLANEHGANAKTHEEESTKAVQQVHTALQLQPVTVDNRNRHDCNETVERVECGELKLLLVHHCYAERHLHKDRELSDTCVPPQGTCAQRGELVR